MKLQIMGFGPASLGLFVAADRQHQLEQFLEGGVVIHERAASLAHWSGLEYMIAANSPVKDFLAGIRRDGIFAPCLATPKIQNWIANGEQIISLKEVANFLRSLAQVVVDLAAKHPDLTIHWNSDIASIQKTGERFISIDKHGSTLASERMVLASGSCPRPLEIETQFRLAARDLVDADDLLRGKMDVEIELAIENKEAIIIVGGSHSGISAICYLLEYFGDRIPDGLIHLYSRAEIMLWSRSVTEIIKASPQDIVDSRTGEVNRFAGVRASAKAMYLKICEGQDQRVVYHEGQFDRTTIPAQISRAGKALFVNATGYQPRLPLMQNASGTQIKLDQASGHACKQINTLALMSQGEAITGLYGIGLGYADRGESGFEVGINFFHGVCAGNLVNAIVTCEQRVAALMEAVV